MSSRLEICLASDGLPNNYPSMTHWLANPWARAAAIIVGSAVVAFVIQFVFRHVVFALLRKTKTTVDDQIADILRRPVYLSVIMVSIAWAVRVAPVSNQIASLTDGALKTLAVVIWSLALSRVAGLVFRALADRATSESLVQPQTQPLFDIFTKLLLFAVASYGVLLAWDINVGAWMASAGIAGLALSFAAKDTLSNLFAGIFIVADAPYKVGDFIALDGGKLRGSVTAIGFRSTRLLTLEDVEIIVPNSVMGNAQIINESGGPYRKARVTVTVECAYGSDSDQVKDVLLKCAEGAPLVSSDPKPLVRFAEFGASGLVHELLVWAERPRYRELVIDDLNRRIYKAFTQNGIEIPYSKHDVFIKQIPPGLEPRGKASQAA